MRHAKGLMIVLIVIGSAAIAAQNVSYMPDTHPWESQVTESSSPDVAYGFSNFNTSPGRFDRNGDGRVDLVIADRNGDGRGDYWATDRNYDSLIDDYQYDRNLDGKIDQWEYDMDYDGISDKIYVDSNRDGQPDMYADLDQVSKTYSWYGNFPGVKGAKMGFPGFSPKRLATGRYNYSN